MPSLTSEATIAKLRDVFCRYGIPQQLVSDNGSQFTSEECCKFMKANGIKHTLVAPYHPRSNGQAERFVQTFKQFFKAEDSDSIMQSLARFLFSYRTTPNSTTGQTPAELFLNRRLGTRLDLMRPDLGRKVFDRQTDQKARYDKTSEGREFTLGGEVLVQNFRGEPKRLDGTVTEQIGPVYYKVLFGEQLWKRHVDQMDQKHLSNKDSKPEISATHSNDTTDIQPVTPPQAETAEKATLKPNETKSSENDNDEGTHAAATAQPQPQTRNPIRQRRAPKHLGFNT